MTEPTKHTPAVNLDRELAADRARFAIEWLREWANEPMSVEKLMTWTEDGGFYAKYVVDSIGEHVARLEGKDKT